MALGDTAPAPGILAGLQNAVGAADLDGVSVYLSIYPAGSSVTPLTPQARAQFTAFATSLARSLPSVHRFTSSGRGPRSYSTMRGNSWRRLLEETC